MSRLILFAAFALGLSGCALGPDFRVPETDLPQQWPQSMQLIAADHEDGQQWWQRFEDPMLNQLVEQAVAENLSLKLQLQRIEQARAHLGLTKADRLPSLSAQAQAVREQTPELLGGGSPRNHYALAAMLNYEIDLWGRLERQREAAVAQLDHSIFGAEAVRQSLIADVVTSYVNMQAAEQAYRVALENLDSREKSLELEEIRYAGGVVSSMVVSRSRAAVENVRAQLPGLQHQIQRLQLVLAVLIGSSPEELFEDTRTDGRTLAEITLPKSVPAILPAELLRRRPDVRAAEADLAAASARIGATMASAWPSLNLASLLGTAAPEVSDLFSQASHSWNVGATLAGPIFDFGRTRARVESAQAVRDQAETAYQMTVTGAFRDVRSALILYAYANDQYLALNHQFAALAELIHSARTQYEYGAISQHELLDVERQLLSVRQALAHARSEQLTAVAALFKALGGDWQGG